MALSYSLHPKDPQVRLVKRIVEVVREGGLIAYPTDSGYALGCHIGDKHAMERIARLRDIGSDHNFTLVCRDLSEIATYAKVDDWAYRVLKRHTPGPYTFILPATREVPRRLQNPKRKTIGIRVPDHRVAQALLAELGEPLMSSTLLLPGDDLPLAEPDEIRERLEHQVEVVIDAGYCAPEPTTVVEIAEGRARVVRVGKGDPAAFEQG
jgi:tRNA threonylcarbamoyl adenosine modification protein (Sua5/YciO/YrdC/YwlC family)